MNVSVVLAHPAVQQVFELSVETGCTARQAVEAAVRAGLDCEVAKIDPNRGPIGIYGERVSDDAQLSEGDRVEIYRPLKQDPMELRRKRAASETTGLLPKRRK